MRGTGIDTPRLQNFFLLPAQFHQEDSRGREKKIFAYHAQFHQGEEEDSRVREKIFASSGNRTRAARVAGEHSTTEPTMLDEISSQHKLTYNALGGGRNKKNFAVGRIRTYAPRGKLISSQSP